MSALTVRRLYSDAEVDAAIDAAVERFCGALLRRVHPARLIGDIEERHIRESMAEALLAAMQTLPGDSAPTPPGGRVAPSDGVSGQ